MELRSRIARLLEEGRGDPVSRAVAAAWGQVASRSLVKALSFRAAAKVIAIGGSTLGGSGKTPLAIACARSLAETGQRVALVGHAYGGSPELARVVGPHDDVRVVGDEALMAARALAGEDVPVVVGPTRQAAVDLALTLGEVVILDGVAQTRPVPASLALLAVDGVSPWGAGACPPAGDLRAPVAELVAACDRVVVVGEDAEVVSTGAWLAGKKLTWRELRRHRVGLWTSIARPERVLATLRREGVTPVMVAAHADHAEVSERTRKAVAERGRDRRVALWLCTPKCRVRLPPALEATPVAVLEYELRLGRDLEDALRSDLQLLPATSGA